MNIAPYSDKELDEIAALVNAAYRGQASTPGWTSEVELLGGQRTDAGMLREELAATSDATILVMRDEEANEIVASVWLEPSAAETYYLGLLAIRPTRQAGGLGRALLAEAERFAASAGAHTMQMTVIEQRESLIAWYERRGYRRTGATKPFPYEDVRVGVPKRADLRLVVLEKAL
jgi:ribosomal protein S18 acetylase RimI-like enzyme